MGEFQDAQKAAAPGTLKVLYGGNAQATVKPMVLGQRLREIRKDRRLTLEEVSQLTGLARSTLSKIENEQISPTFQAMQKLVQGLEIDMPQLFTQPSHRSASGRRDLIHKGQGKLHPTPTYEHELLAPNLTRKRMVPFKSIIRARSFDEFGDWVRHDGEEFLLVLEGSAIFYSEFYEPAALSEGDSVYYDCTMGHAITSTSEQDAVILWITAS